MKPLRSLLLLILLLLETVVSKEVIHVTEQPPDQTEVDQFFNGLNGFFVEESPGLRCFPVVLSGDERSISWKNFKGEDKKLKETLEISFQVIKYEPAFRFAKDAERNETHVLATVFRKKHIKNDMVFRGKSGLPLKVCSDEAIELGYCKEKHKGKLLFHYTDPETSKRLVVNEIIKDMDIHHEAFIADETGVYCIKALAPYAKSFELEVIVDDGHGASMTERHHTTYLFISWILFCSIDVVFVLRWALWVKSQAKLAIIPFPAKVLLIDAIFWIISNTLTTLNDLTFESGLVERVKGLVNDSWKLWFETFMLYQWAGDFSHAPVIEYTGIKRYALAQLIIIVQFIIDLLNDYTSLKITGTLMSTINSVMAKLLTLYINFTVLRRLWQTRKQYKKFKKTQLPIYKQFTWLFLYEYVFLPSCVVAMMAEKFLIDHVLSIFSTAFHKNYMIDGEVPVFGRTPTFIFGSAYICAWQGLTLLRYWTPNYFEKAEQYKDRIE